MTGRFRKDEVIGRQRAAQWPVRALVAALLAGLALAGPASAAPTATVVGTGPGTCDQTAYSPAVGAGGTITFDCGGPATIALNTVKVIAHDTTLIGGDVITLSAGLTARLFVVNPGVSLTLEHIVLDGAASTGSDGGAIANHGALILDHTTIQHSQTDSSHSGGAIFSDGPVTITHSLLADNRAGSAGALFANFGQAVVTISDSTFRGNETVNTITGFGGAIWVGQQAQVSITGGAILSNSARFGGGLYLSLGVTATLTSAGPPALVQGNTASLAGGGVYNSGRLAMTNVTMQDNAAHNADSSVLTFGGGVDNFQGQVTAQAVDAAGNSASVGGGLFAQLGSVQGVDVLLRNNTAITGGGLDVESDPLTINRWTISGNKATGPGGGVYAHLTPMILTHSSFTANTAGTRGGGLDLEYALANIDHLVFSGNQAPLGGGLSLEALSDVALSQVQLTGNAGDKGGGLYADNSRLSLLGVALSANTATHEGGGLYFSSGQVTLDNSTVSGNTAAFGAGLYVGGGGLAANNSTLSGNAASNAGGGLYHAASAVVLTAVTLSGNAAPNGGGLESVQTLVTQSLTLSNTILAAGVQGSNCSVLGHGGSDIVSAGYNLSSDSSCAGSLSQTGDLNHTNPQLGALTNNGGPTPTHLPASGSPAVDAILAGTNGCGTTLISDQRGAPRPIHALCDIGAVEAGWFHPELWLPLIRR